MEGLFEEESQLRRCVEHELLSENISPDQALKVLVSTSNKSDCFTFALRCAFCELNTFASDL